MTFRKAICVPNPEGNKMSELIVEPQSTITTTVKKVIHKSVFEYNGKDDFSAILLSEPVKKAINEYFCTEGKRGKEYHLFTTISLFKWRKVVEEEDKNNPEFWCCNLVFARNLFHRIFSKGTSAKSYVDQEVICILPFTLLNPKRLSADDAMSFANTLKGLSPELQHWEPCGENPKL